MKNLIISILFFTSSLTLFSQNYYWVGGSGNWSDFTNHWATTSGGSTFHTQVPTSTDNVIFDANSFNSFGQVVTLDVVADCNSMDWTGVSDFPVIDGNGNDMNIYGSLTLSPDMTADFNDLEFESSTIGNTITTNSTSLGSNSNLRFNGVSGEWTLQDNLETANLYMVAGTLNTNNNDMNTGNRFITSGSNPKILNLGSSQITTARWWMQGTNLTINSGTSRIITSGSFYGDTTGDGPFTYYDVEFPDDASLRNNASFNEIIIAGGSTITMTSGDIFTINNLVAMGTKFTPIILKTTTGGSEVTFSAASGTIDVSYVELQDIHASGGATFTANNSIDNGNNTGWTINAPVPQNYYWVGNGGDWSDFANHWATSSGGTTFHSDYPGRYDNVFFDANSFSSTSETVNLDIDADCGNMDWTGTTNSPRFYGQFGIRLNIHGSATFTDAVDKDVYTTEMEGNGTHSITYGENGDFVIFRINGSGTFNFQDSVRVGLDIQFNNGTSNLNGNPISAGRAFELVEGTVNAGASNIYCDDFEFLNSSSTPVFNAGTSTVLVTDQITVNSTINRSFTFNDLILEGTVTVDGAHTIENLLIRKGSSISFEESTITVINGDLTIESNKADPISLSSTVGGSQATLSKSTGIVDATYLILQDIDATGGAVFNATQTIDNGNNSGWNITGLTGEDYYWVGNGGDWSDFENHWATTSGGSTFHITVPGVLDNVFFDANSFSVANEVVTVNGSNANCNDLDASLAAQFFTVSGSTKEINIYGSIDLSANSNLDFGTFNFLTTGSATIDFAGGPGGNWDANFLSAGTWTFESDVNLSQLNMENGTLNTEGFTFDIGAFTFLGADAKVLNMGTSSLILNAWRSDNATNVTVNGASSELTIKGTYLIDDDLSENVSLNNFKVTESPIIYTDMVVNQFTIEPGTELSSVGDVSITMNDLTATGTELLPIIIQPQTVSSSFTFIQASGTVDAYYLELEEITATGGATFNAFNSIDNGGVVGWVFNRLSQTITFDPLGNKTFGDAPFILEATASSGLDVSYEIVSGPASLTENQLTITGAGTVQVKAEQLGDANYDPAPSVIRTFEVAEAGQTIFFEALAARTFGDVPFTLTATGGGSSSPVIFTSSNLNVATVNGNEVTIVGAGATTITASQEGDANYTAATNVDQELVISKANQAIVFEALSARTFGDAPFTLNATGGGSTSPVIFTSSNLNVATVNGNELTIVGAGTTTITASQDGDANYTAAANVDQELVINKANQTIIFEALSAQTFGDAPFTLAATGGGSSSPVIFTSSNLNVATLDGEEVTIVGAGTAIITASQEGDDNYLAATNVDQELVIDKSNQTITFTQILDYELGVDTDAIVLDASASSGLVVTYTVNGPADLSGNNLTPTGSGTVTVTASQSGNNNYNAAAEVEVTFQVIQEVALGLEQLTIEFYPNPTNDRFEVKGLDGSRNSSLQIYSLKGELVEHFVKVKGIIDISNLKPGIYLISLLNGKQVIKVERLVVE